MKILKPAFALFCLALCVAVLSGSQPVKNTAFYSSMKKIADANDSSRIVEGREGWLFLESEITHLAKQMFWGDAANNVSVYRKPDGKDPLPAIVDFSDQLKSRGIDLIFVPVPAKAAVYPEKLDSALNTSPGERLDYYHYEFLELLKNRGVHVLDIMPVLMAKRGGSNPVYCKTDAHWSPYAVELTASALAGEIKKQGWYKNSSTVPLSSEKTTVNVSGDLAENGEKENISLRIITGDDGKYLSTSSDSPVILLGDSHTLVFHEGGDMLAQGAGLADQLAWELKFPVDLIGVRGSGSTASRINLFRKSKSDPDYLSGKKTVIWCMTVREFTESTGGWKKVPVSP